MIFLGKNLQRIFQKQLTEVFVRKQSTRYTSRRALSEGPRDIYALFMETAGLILHGKRNFTCYVRIWRWKNYSG